MSLILRNLKNLFQKQRQFAVLIILTQMAGTFALCFVLGVLYNNQYSVLEDENNTLRITMTFGGAEGDVSWDNLQGCIQEICTFLDENLLEVYISRTIMGENGSFTSVIAYTSWDDQGFCIAETVEDIYDYQIYEGRNLTQEDYRTGALVALETTGRCGEMIELAGVSYEVVGLRCEDLANAGYNIIAIPLSSWPDMAADTAEWRLNRLPTYAEYEEICDILEKYLSGQYTISDYYGGSADLKALYRSLSVAVAGILLATTGTLMMLYSFVMEKRKYALAIFRLSGCKRTTCIRMHVTEVALLAAPSCIGGVGVFFLLRFLILDQVYHYMAVLFTLPVCALCSLVVFGGIILESLVLAWVKTGFSVKDLLRGE